MTGDQIEQQHADLIQRLYAERGQRLDDYRREIASRDATADEALAILREATGRTDYHNIVEAAREAARMLKAAESDANQAKNGLMVSEGYRRKYAEGKGAIYAMGGEFTEAAAKHLPWGSEGPLERYTRQVEREHSPLLVEHLAMLVEKLKAAKLDTARMDRLEALPGRVDITYDDRLPKNAAPSLRSQIDYFLARLDAGKP